jgi:hypothetical protein
MSRTTRGTAALLTALALLALCAGRSNAQYYVAAAPAPVVSYYTPAVSYYYTPAVSYYYAPRVSYYAPATSYYAPAASYYAPAVSYYAPAVSYYAPAASYYAPAASVTTYRYGLLGRPRAAVTTYYGYGY